MIRYDGRGNGQGSSPPGFLEARNRRQKARAAGLSPDYFYPVEQSKNLGRGQVLGTRFWGRPIAVFRDEKGQVQALEDRCAHRQLKLSLGQVKGCNLTCQYHGWEYDGSGQVVAIPHELFGKPFPELRIGAFPVQERYGLIWVFPGDPALAKTRFVPDIPELEGKGRWQQLIVDCQWQTHHSMIIDNLGDFTSVHLRRRFTPLFYAPMTLTRCEAVGERVYVSYDTKVGGGNFFRRFADRTKLDKNPIDVCYEYPYRWLNIGDKLKNYCFVLPMDERSSRVFSLFYFQTPRVPFVPMAIPAWLLNPFLNVANKLLVTPLLMEQRGACEAELEGYTRYYDSPVAEFNPAILLFQQLIIRKWEEYLASRNLVSAGTLAPAARTNT